MSARDLKTVRHSGAARQRRRIAGDSLQPARFSDAGFDAGVPVFITRGHRHEPLRRYTTPDTRSNHRIIRIAMTPKTIRPKIEKFGRSFFAISVPTEHTEDRSCWTPAKAFGNPALIYFPKMRSALASIFFLSAGLSLPWCSI